MMMKMISNIMKCWCWCWIYDSKQKRPALHTSERTIVPRTVIFIFIVIGVFLCVFFRYLSGGRVLKNSTNFSVLWCGPHFAKEAYFGKLPPPISNLDFSLSHLWLSSFSLELLDLLPEDPFSRFIPFDPFYIYLFNWVWLWNCNQFDGWNFACFGTFGVIPKILLSQKWRPPNWCRTMCVPYHWMKIKVINVFVFFWGGGGIPHICHRRCLCKLFLSGVKFLWRWSMYFTNVV